MSSTAIALIGAGVAIGGALFTIFIVIRPCVRKKNGSDTSERS